MEHYTKIEWETFSLYCTILKAHVQKIHTHTHKHTIQRKVLLKSLNLVWIDYYVYSLMYECVCDRVYFITHLGFGDEEFWCCIVYTASINWEMRREL